MNIFAGEFFKFLKEDQEAAELEAWKRSLDDNTDPSEFDVQRMSEIEDSELAAHTAAATEAALKRHLQQVKQIKGWIIRLESFKDFLNGTANSVMLSVSEAEEDTILKSLEDQQSRITRAATEIASLLERFNTAIATENDPSYSGV